MNSVTDAKRARRSKAEMDDIRTALAEIVAEIQPATVRQVFYQAVSRGIVRKTEQEYKGTVCRLLSEMRRAGVIPFGSIADNTRWMRKPKTHSGPDAALWNAAASYRRQLWDNQEAYVEVWLEKDALAGVLYPITAEYDVPLMVTRGYPSLSFVYEAAEAMAEQNKPVHIYYLGDHDPSGLDIPRSVEANLREFAPDADITFERIAVTLRQIAQWNLPTRPTKTTDSRAGGFDGESVEVDAIPPATLRQLVQDSIEQHIDGTALDVMRTAEESERDILMRIARRDFVQVRQFALYG